MTKDLARLRAVAGAGAALHPGLPPAIERLTRLRAAGAGAAPGPGVPPVIDRLTRLRPAPDAGAARRLIKQPAAVDALRRGLPR